MHAHILCARIKYAARVISLRTSDPWFYDRPDRYNGRRSCSFAYIRTDVAIIANFENEFVSPSPKRE